jgi:hypothetical protein
MAGTPNGVDIGFPSFSGWNMSLTYDSGKDPYHVLDYRWDGTEPVLSARKLERSEDGSLLYVDMLRIVLSKLPQIDLRAGKVLYCVGRIVNGEHAPCEGHEVADGFAQCMPCLTRDIPDPACIFEPQCHRGSCGAFFCQKSHVVYLAMYRHRMKIGMTQTDRVMERATEQGADLILPLARTADRYSARALEGWLSSRGISESVPTPVVLKMLDRSMPLAEMREKAVNYLEKLQSQQVLLQDILKSRRIRIETMPRDMPSEPLIPGPYPIPEKLEAVPRAIPVDIVRGDVVGFKGKIGVIRSNGSLAAFKVGDLVGRIVEIDPSTLQNG